MSGLEGYFIAPDGDGDLWVWRERGNRPVPVISQDSLGDDLPVWDALVSLVEGAS